MPEPKLNYLPCPDSAAGHRMAYWEWGDATASHVIVCAHGLSRQGRDFDVLAQDLLAHAKGPLRVVCPDVVGRGASDWLANPLGYQVPTYVADMLALLAHLKPTVLDWVGTSMGGLIGMGVCAGLGVSGAGPSQAARVPLGGSEAHAVASAGARAVRRLVLNDVGPAIEWEAVARIATYLGRDMEFDSLQQAADALWSISSSFGPHTSAQWLELTRHMVKPVVQGCERVRLHYDPAIAVPIAAATAESVAQGETLLWQVYDAITAQTLLLRGAQSDLLTVATAQQMTLRGPHARLVEFANIGHAPTLIAPDQVAVVRQFLLE